MNFDLWLEELKNNWIKKDINKILELFDKDVIYFETPFEQVTDIETVWHDIDDTDIKDLSYTVLGTKYNEIVANYVLTLQNDEVVDMVYQIVLNDKNKCVYFKQWYMHR